VFFRRLPWFLLQALSHRVLRWAVPFFLVLAFAANLFLLDRPEYLLLFLAQVALYGAAALAYVLERRNVRLPGLVIPLYFCIVNLAPLLAVRALLRGEHEVRAGREHALQLGVELLTRRRLEAAHEADAEGEVEARGAERQGEAVATHEAPPARAPARLGQHARAELQADGERHGAEL